MNEDGAFSRTGLTGPYGKFDDRIEAFRINSVIKEGFAQVAASRGKPAIEYLRFVMMVIAVGPERAKKIACDEVDEVVRLLGGESQAVTWQDES